MAKFYKPDKLNLAYTPTPIQLMRFASRLGSKFSEVEIFVKRDDLNAGLVSGNKIRKLEYLLADAQRKHSKVIVTCGGIQSNHARATAILCRQLGFECVLLLRDDHPNDDAEIQGNLLLDQLMGAKVLKISSEQYLKIEEQFAVIDEFYRQRDGISPYFIPEGGTNALGVLGIADLFSEILAQCGKDDLPASFDSIVLANGSGGTHAGLVVGRLFAEEENQFRIFSFNVGRTALEMKDRVLWAALGAIQLSREPVSLMPDEVNVIDGYVGPGYARATPELYSFLTEIAQTDGIALDPVYTGKAMRGLITELNSTPERAGVFGKKILFLHTGGFPAIFAHAKQFAKALLCTLLLSTALEAAVVPKKHTENIHDVVQSLMLEGKRAEAVAKIDEAIDASKSKSIQKDLRAKRMLVLEQFLTTENFQTYIEAGEYADLSRWSDCVAELGSVQKVDADNLQVLLLKSECSLRASQYSEATQIINSLLLVLPKHPVVQLLKVELLFKTKQVSLALEHLARADEKSEYFKSEQKEQSAILKAKILETSAKVNEGIDVLKKDQEGNLDHIEVLYELGRLYAVQMEADEKGAPWQARKYLSLFLSRCKRLNELQVAKKTLATRTKRTLLLVPSAEALMAKVEKRLELSGQNRKPEPL